MMVSKTRSRSTLLSDPSPLQRHIRTNFLKTPSTSQASENQSSIAATRRAIEQAEQFVQYIKAQRMYTTLVERYNPGMTMSEEEKVRLTARRVGMDLPVELMKGNK
jgi:ATP synthase assembly factor FMC1, mitochondrial